MMKRRQFIKTVSAGLGTFHIVPRHVLGGPGFVPPSEKVNIALVGAGGRGLQNMRALFAQKDAQIIAVVDPAGSYDLGRFYRSEENRFAGSRPARAEIESHYSSYTANFRCSEYEDFRVMLDRETAVDAVLCSAPDHLHAHVSVAAMEAGKHVYCEKPLTHNIWEARHVAKVARKAGVATQMGNQGHSTVGIRETVEYLRDGAIGTVREVHAWVFTQPSTHPLFTKHAEPSPVPSGLNWDLWLGPCKPRPYHPACHPVGWRDFWAFGGGGLADMGCHDFDAAMWALDLQMPSRVEAFGSGPISTDIAPFGGVAYFGFPARNQRPAVQLTWHSGGLKPRTPDVLGRFPLPKRGVLFVGDKGAIQCDGGGGAPRLFPDSLRASYRKPAPSIKRSNGHQREWLDACKGGAPAKSSFDYGARLTEIVLVGVLALRAGHRIEWDAENMRANGLARADAWIRESYRQGWEIV